MRASDRDRERALAALRAGCAEGYLSIDTFERRVEMALAARSVAELRPAGDGRWLAVDVGSLNGTWLLDRRVGRVMVRSGDELWLGSCPVRLA
jgi:Domain of unknown function (DUF1707)/FHA domain